MEHVKKIAEKIDSLSLRERTIVFVGIIFVIFTVWDSFLMSPLEKEQKDLVKKLNEKNVEQTVLHTQFQKLLQTNNTDPDAENLAHLKKLRSRLIEIQAELETSTENLISPQDMPKVLETVLHKTGDLTLVNLRSLGVTPLITKSDEGSEVIENVDENSASNETRLTADNIDNAYRHGLRIEFKGNYLTALDYLKSLEELEWGFFWDNFQLTVSEYPESNAAVEIFTLSLKQEWIGV